MKPLRSVFIIATMLALVGLLLSACESATVTSAAVPTPSVLPTAAVPTAAAAPVVVPTSIPSLPPAVVTPTPRPLPPTPTLQPSGPGGQPFPLRTERLEFGVAAHLFYTNRGTPLAAARDAGFGWIRQQIHWKDQEGPSQNYVWGELEDIVHAVDAYNLKLMVSIVRSPEFYTADGGDGLPANPKNMGDFVEALARRYPGQIGAIEIWNEQNLAHENGGTVTVADASRYVELLKECYTRIKAVDPSIYVIAGPPSSTAVNSPGVAVDDISYYKAMYTYQNGVMRNYFDAQAVHPGGSANPPDTLWPDNPSPAQGWTDDSTFYFRHIENVRAVMEKYGMAEHPIWITEFGWATHNTSPGFEFGEQVSFEQQADYIVGAMRRTADQYPWVDAMFLWNLNFAPLRAQSGEPLHEQASFGILDANYRPRPAYYAVQAYIAELRAQGR